MVVSGKVSRFGEILVVQIDIAVLRSQGDSVLFTIGLDGEVIFLVVWRVEVPGNAAAVDSQGDGIEIIFFGVGGGEGNTLTAS